MANEPPPESFYLEVAPKNFSVKRVKRGFQMDQSTYVDCCDTLKREMVSLGLLGRTLNTRDRKRRLVKAFSVLDLTRPDIFSRVPREWKVPAQYAMARSINNTERRRASSPEARERVAAFSELPRQPFETMTIHIWRRRDGDIATCSCSVKDVLRKDMKKKDEIQVEDLSFPEFSRLIARDQMVAFRHDVDTLSYSVRGHGHTRYPMRDERAWRTGIETMYWQTQEINIHVESRAGVESRFLLSTLFSEIC